MFRNRKTTNNNYHTYLSNLPNNDSKTTKIQNQKPNTLTHNLNPYSFLFSKDFLEAFF